MAKASTNGPTTGLNPSTMPRYHYDIYAILEGAQEIYFGNEVAVNVNLVETVKLAGPDGSPEGGPEKCYISPTKRRGVERRTLLWAPVASGVLLGDREECGIPNTCARQDCPICCVFGALQTDKNTSLIGRLTHGGGVAVQPLGPEVKQRAMHPSVIAAGGKERETPMPFKREYNEPALLYPVYNHCLSITEQEFESVAYAFLNALSRLGAGNPKGVRIAEGEMARPGEPLLVIDRYLAPLGKRPVASPSEDNPANVRSQFRAAAFTVYGEPVQAEEVNRGPEFARWIGDAALLRLQQYALDFTRRVLQRG